MLKISFKKCTQYFNPCPLRYNVLSFEIYHPEAENLAIFCYYFDVYNPINDSEDLNFNENHLRTPFFGKKGRQFACFWAFFGVKI